MLLNFGLHRGKKLVSLATFCFVYHLTVASFFRSVRKFNLRHQSTVKMAALSALDETSKIGKFIRTASDFRDIISANHPMYQPEIGRYHLIISYACPWANRCLTVLRIKGLDDCIGVSVVHPTWQRTKPEIDDDLHCGWVFVNSADDPPLASSTGFGSFSTKDCVPNTVNEAKTVREFYEMCTPIDAPAPKKFTVPILYDKKTKTIVNNESSEIIRILNKEFDMFATGPFASLDLLPDDKRIMIDELNTWIYSSINDGVYKSGFAKSQYAYDEV